MNLFASTIYKIAEWVMRFAFLQVLWVFFTIIGFVILGFFPATIAMFATVRAWLQGNTELPVFQTFWQYFKSEFLQGNLFGIFVWMMIGMICLDFYFIYVTFNSNITWFHIPLAATILFIFLFLFYLFPVYVHYNVSLLHVFKHTLIILFVNPFIDFMMIISLIAFLLIIKMFPALAFIFGGSAYAFITMWLSLKAFQHIQKKQAA